MGLFKGLDGPAMRHDWHYSLYTYGAFTLTEAETSNETETDKIVPKGISVSVQYEYLYTILTSHFITVRKQSLGQGNIFTDVLTDTPFLTDTPHG